MSQHASSPDGTDAAQSTCLALHTQPVQRQLGFSTTRA
jgi:hypothetical protein